MISVYQIFYGLERAQNVLLTGILIALIKIGTLSVHVSA